MLMLDFLGWYVLREEAEKSLEEPVELSKKLYTLFNSIYLHPSTVHLYFLSLKYALK